VSGWPGIKGNKLGQSKVSSFFESCINTAIGFVVSLGLTAIVFPAYGLQVSFFQNLQITAIYTVASIARGYVVRRWFNGRIHAAAERIAARAS